MRALLSACGLSKARCFSCAGGGGSVVAPWTGWGGSNWAAFLHSALRFRVSCPARVGEFRNREWSKGGQKLRSSLLTGQPIFRRASCFPPLFDRNWVLMRERLPASCPGVPRPRGPCPRRAGPAHRAASPCRAPARSGSSPSQTGRACARRLLKQCF